MWIDLVRELDRNLFAIGKVVISVTVPFKCEPAEEARGHSFDDFSKVFSFFPIDGNLGRCDVTVRIGGLKI